MTANHIITKMLSGHPKQQSHTQPRTTLSARRHVHKVSMAHLFGAASAVLLALLCILQTTQHVGEAANVAINNRTVEDWLVVDLAAKNTYKPMFVNNHSAVPHDDVSHWPVNTYYWQAPEPYYQWKIYTYGGDLKFLVNHIVTRGDTSGEYLDEPDLVLEGGPREHHMKIGYKLPKEEDVLRGYDKNQTIRMPLTEHNWYHLVEHVEEGSADTNTGVKQSLKLGNIPVSRADFSLVLAGLDRSLIRAKYHMDQVEGDLYDVNMHLYNNKSRTIECDNNCSGKLLDDLDDIGLLFDEIRRLAPGLKDGPWRRLAYLNRRADNLTEALSQYLKLIALGKEVIENRALNFDQETLADILELRARNLESRVPEVAYDAYLTKLLAEKTLEDLLNGLWGKIRKTIIMLKEHGFGPNGLSPGKIERIVQESEMILRELRNRNLKPYLDDAERELRKATILLDKIRTLLIDPKKSGELLKRLEQLNKVLTDFSRIVQDQVLKPTEKANELVREGKKKYQAILALLKESEERGRESQTMLNEARNLLEITKKCLSDEAQYLDKLPRQLIELNNSIHEIELKRSILTQVNPEYKKKYVDKCREHGDLLVKKSQELDGLFNATRDVADYALRAANVYKNIADAIDGAEKAAKRAFDAAEKAYKVAVPDFDESLADKARESKRVSLELLEKAKKLREQDVQRLALELAKRRQIVDQLFESMRALVQDLDQINAGLKQLADKNFLEQLQEIDAFLKRLLERIADIHKRLKLMWDLIYNSLLPQYERLSAGSQSSLGNLSQVIDTARKDLASAIKYSSSSKGLLEKILKLEAKLDLDLDMLRRKIQLAHQEAATVHVSMMPSSESGVCTRSYFIPASMSALEGSGVQVGGFGVRQISLTWSLHHDEPESLLLFLGSKAGDEFMALEMYERRIRLVYSLKSHMAPGSIQVLTHPRLIELNDKAMLSDEAWYLIQVHMGAGSEQVRLSVKPMGPKQSQTSLAERDTQQVSARLALQPMSSSRLSVSPYGEAEVQFFVGGLPPASDFSAPSEIKSTRLTGCLYNLQLNDQQVGLWNFKSNHGCEGCTEGPSEQRDVAVFSLSGHQSYANVQQIKHYDRTKYMVSMSAKTNEPDALLFLALSEKSNHYLSVHLAKGKVVYLIGKLSPSQANYLGLSSASLFDYAMSAHLQHLSSSSSYSSSSYSSSPGNGSSNTNTSGAQSPTPSAAAAGQQPLEHVVVSSREYNSGQWFRITAEKDQNKLALAVDDEFRESIVDDKLLSLDMDQVFFGGVWPILRPRRYGNTSLEFTPFSGCLKDIQIDTSSVDLLRRQSHGVERGCHQSRSGPVGSGSLVSGARSTSRTGRLVYPLPAGK